MTTHDELDDGLEPATPVWAVFGDLMAGLVGAFVLILVAALGMQFELAERLKAEVQQHQAEVQRREALERALAIPLAAGRVTLTNGRIGISGSVLFGFNSAELQPEGRQLLASLAGPLAAYLSARDELLMVSGFTDDRQVRDGGRGGCAGVRGVRRGLRRRAAGGLERRRRGPRAEPARRDGADTAPEGVAREVVMSAPEAHAHADADADEVAFDPIAAVEAWRVRGAARIDPVRFGIVEALARRAAALQGEARRLLTRRLAALLAEHAVANAAPAPTLRRASA